MFIQRNKYRMLPVAGFQCKILQQFLCLFVTYFRTSRCLWQLQFCKNLLAIYNANRMRDAFKKVGTTFCMLRQYCFYLVVHIFNNEFPHNFHCFRISFLAYFGFFNWKNPQIPEAQSHYPHVAPVNTDPFPCLFNQPYQWEQSPIWQILNSFQPPTLSYMSTHLFSSYVIRQMNENIY